MHGLCAATLHELTDTLVIDAQDVEILWDTDDARLTLVTCFPFDARH
jgi:sortase (surface protein transpeptidase)